MSGQVINLRRAHKQKDRAGKEAIAAENRRRHGRSKAEKQAEAISRKQEERHIDGHKRDRD